MKKNNYIKPNMVVVELRHQTRLLAGSPGSDNGGDANTNGARRIDWDD